MNPEGAGTVEVFLTVEVFEMVVVVKLVLVTVPERAVTTEVLVIVTVVESGCAVEVIVLNEVGVDPQLTVEVVVSVSTLPGGGWVPNSVWHRSDGEAVDVTWEVVAATIEPRNVRRLIAKALYRIFVALLSGPRRKQVLERPSQANPHRRRTQRCGEGRRLTCWEPRSYIYIISHWNRPKSECEFTQPQAPAPPGPKIRGVCSH